eukprot:349932-Chlamydomonas_euryale.AAC.5
MGGRGRGRRGRGRRGMGRRGMGGRGMGNGTAATHASSMRQAHRAHALQLKKKRPGTLLLGIVEGSLQRGRGARDVFTAVSIVLGNTASNQGLSKTRWTHRAVYTGHRVENVPQRRHDAAFCEAMSRPVKVQRDKREG